MTSASPIHRADPKLDAELDKLAAIFKPIVSAIEATKHPITLHNYGEYMAVISRIASRQGDPTNKSALLGVAMQRAGANKLGVQSALRAMGAI